MAIVVYVIVVVAEVVAVADVFAIVINGGRNPQAITLCLSSKRDARPCNKKH